MHDTAMESEQWLPTNNANSQSNSTSTLGYHKEVQNYPHHDKRPKWRRVLSSKIFWSIAVMAVLLLALILGLSISLTHSKKAPPPKRPAQIPTPPPAQVLGPKIDLGYTTVQGLSYPGGISQWLGVRYAQPPLGDLRFAEPQNVTANATLQMVTEVSLVVR